MAKFASPEFLFGSAVAFKAAVNKMVLLKAYTAGDVYATVQANNIGEVAVVSTDFTLAVVAGGDCTMTGPSGKSTTATVWSGTSPNLHIAFIDSIAGKLWWVTDEISDQVVIVGNTVNFPSGLTYTFKQPV